MLGHKLDTISNKVGELLNDQASEQLNMLNNALIATAQIQNPVSRVSAIKSRLAESDDATINAINQAIAEGMRELSAYPHKGDAHQQKVATSRIGKAVTATALAATVAVGAIGVNRLEKASDTNRDAQHHGQTLQSSLPEKQGKQFSEIIEKRGNWKERLLTLKSSEEDGKPVLSEKAQQTIDRYITAVETCSTETANGGSALLIAVLSLLAAVGGELIRRKNNGIDNQLADLLIKELHVSVKDSIQDSPTQIATAR